MTQLTLARVRRWLAAHSLIVTGLLYLTCMILLGMYGSFWTNLITGTAWVAALTWLVRRRLIRERRAAQEEGAKSFWQFIQQRVTTHPEAGATRPAGSETPQASSPQR